ncbi:hypothetical protein LEL_05847 [Akanthomyces lecanii RCEF 1005]|uniref:Zn(2)-C6 fungal-type domain-containing protein n=1 Tax=Akanthomyces lecanii RCEF 1005 TaxID=1081108 RepID=A0A168G8C9_CORDF|nr:hypothetical protein LEL_05847 [Akanthomyces lecanii RCEF 1005]
MRTLSRQKAQACGQCLRAKVQCAGYKDQLTLRMRDETHATAQKVLAAQERTSKYKSKPSILQEKSFEPLIYNSLGIDSEQVCLNHFMSYYAATSLFEYLPRLYDSIEMPKGDLNFALSVPGLAILSEDMNVPALLDLAYARYVSLLEIVQRALPVPELAVKDSTLLSVLLLALFESLVFRGRQSPTNWTAHIEGAAQLLQLRGRKQFEQPVGRHLFLQTSHSLRTSCITHGIPVPSIIGSLQSQHAGVQRIDEHGPLIGAFLDRLAAFHAFASTMQASQFLQESRALVAGMDSMFAFLQRTAPPEPMVDLHLPEIANVFQLYFGADLHKSQRSAWRWNTTFMLRLLLSDFIGDGLNRIDEEDGSLRGNLGEHDRTWLYDVAVLPVKDLVKGVFRSVPYMTNLSGCPQHSAKSLVLPLACIARCKSASEAAKMDALNCLTYIGMKYGLHMATETANMAREACGIEDW